MQSSIDCAHKRAFGKPKALPFGKEIKNFVFCFAFRSLNSTFACHSVSIERIEGDTQQTATTEQWLKESFSRKS
ncbi:MAG: hypothetical protein IKH88_09420 [Prevotella sp.]|nr:hypothetical protein [Prevotella sp.]